MEYDVLIIGGGQAGLVMGYYLSQSRVSFLIVDKEKAVGETWRSRYDSLILFTPRSYSSLPGLKLPGRQNEFPTRDDMVQYLETYATTFSLPIQHETEVLSLVKKEKQFEVQTNKGTFHAKQVIVATGPFQKPSIPDISKQADSAIIQMHSSQYKQPAQLQEGAVLVVGGGNSGTQIAVELAEKHDVYLSVGQKIRFLPITIASKSIFWLFDLLGLLNASRESFFGKKLQAQGDPIFGYELKEQLQKGTIKLKPRTKNIQKNEVFFEDNHSIKVSNIIWATGFFSDYQWMDIPELFDEKGKPIHQRGITQVEGLYFLGLPWQHRRGSSLLLGVGEDAKYLYQHIMKNY
ncbi:putative flavoprotein involved in K+ transport [Bacillus ectoiniformans]|uniref:flavin-containing monooxygenase n=1 Tax=Bacillus ectoiniformans TaxID=1494429 RepID=UPI00195E0454|nr:NAD(P)/FAD-dependent oxidoreductase [Bacillus ectoiniformans]MBM7649010.1 putative flavoprotein involved in K+ transport [Bacillus ectoiniformans]